MSVRWMTDFCPCSSWKEYSNPRRYIYVDSVNCEGICENFTEIYILQCNLHCNLPFLHFHLLVLPGKEAAGHGNLECILKWYLFGRL